MHLSHSRHCKAKDACFVAYLNLEAALTTRVASSADVVAKRRKAPNVSQQSSRKNTAAIAY